MSNPNGRDALLSLISQHEASLVTLRAALDAVPQPASNPLFRDIAPAPVLPPPHSEIAHPAMMAMPPMERWSEVLFKPGFAAAILYVLMPVIEAIGDEMERQNLERRGGPGASGGPSQIPTLLDQLATWTKLTIAQRQALSDLFRWVDGQLSAPESAIPLSILSNMAAAAEAG